MWFKNLQIYRLPAPWSMDLTTLEDQLGRLLFNGCGSQDRVARGWVSPVSGRQGDGVLVHSVQRQWLLALRSEERLLPASVINEEAAARATELELQQGFRPGRKQLRELKEQIEQEFLPRAFTRSRRHFVWINPHEGWLVVDASSPGKAEEVLDALRKCVDDLPLRLLKTQRSPVSCMSDWLAAGEAPQAFTIDRDCELKSVSEEKSTVRYSRHPLEGEQISQELRAHLEAGKLPSRLALTWDERVSFVLTDALEVKRLAFLDVLKEEAEKSAENADELFDANFALMTGELTRLLPELVEVLGGELPEGAIEPSEPVRSNFAASIPRAEPSAMASAPDEDHPFTPPW